MAGFSQAVLDKAAKTQRLIKEQRGSSAEIGAGGLRTHRMDSRLFHQGVAYGRKHGVHQPWDEPNFVQEMEKAHPDIAVDGCSRNGSSPVSAYMLEQAKKLVGG